MLKAKLYFHSFSGGVEFRKSYQAVVTKNAEKTTLEYDEIDENGVTNCQICVISDDFVIVSRKGEFSNYLEFKENYFFSGEYQTPYGEIPVEVFTKKLIVKNENGLLKLMRNTSPLLLGRKLKTSLVS
jgi:uncharacterized beta-barrel protein YwiB (DUF1934 family)